MGFSWPEIREFIAGQSSGWGLVVAGHPFDTLKVRLQSEGMHGRFKGPISCLVDTVKYEGFRGLYKGAFGPLLTQGLVNGWEFGIYGMVISFLKDPDSERGTMKQQWTAGAIAGLATFVVATPQESIKVRVQSQYTKQYDGTVKVAANVWKNEGFRGFFIGGYPTAASRFFFANYICAYETARKYLASDGKHLSPGATMIAGGCAGTAYWLSNYPFDVIKNKMQAAVNTENQYKGMIDCAKHIYRTDGWKGFTRGLSVCLLRALPANATCFLFLEVTRAILPQ